MNWNQKSNNGKDNNNSCFLIYYPKFSTEETVRLSFYGAKIAEKAFWMVSAACLSFSCIPRSRKEIEQKIIHLPSGCGQLFIEQLIWFSKKHKRSRISFNVTENEQIENYLLWTINPIDHGKKCHRGIIIGCHFNSNTNTNNNNYNRVI